MADITVDGQQAAVLYTALELAIGDVKETLVRGSKAAQAYKGALTIQLSAYESEKRRLVEAFPSLK